MTYNLANFNQNQQAAIQALIGKAYGQPNTGINPFVAGEPLDDVVFNLRVSQIEALFSYVEDMRRNDVNRAVTAEQAIKTTFGNLVTEVFGLHGIITSYEGTLTGVNLTLSAGDAAIYGTFVTLPTTNYTVSFEEGVQSLLVTRTDSSVIVRPSDYSIGFNELVVGSWDGSTYIATTSTSLRSTVIQGTEVPTTGTYAAGTVLANLNPTPGLPLMWICTVSGSPGTWEPFLFSPNITTAPATAVEITAQNSDTILQIDTTMNSVMVILPSSSWYSQKELVVKDIGGNARAKNITFTAGAGTVLETPNSITANYASLTFYLDGTTWRTR